MLGKRYRQARILGENKAKYLCVSSALSQRQLIGRVQNPVPIILFFLTALSALFIIPILPSCPSHYTTNTYQLAHGACDANKALCFIPCTILHSPILHTHTLTPIEKHKRVRKRLLSTKYLHM
jgi:hypothetical protein